MFAAEIFIQLKRKIKFTLEKAMKVQRELEIINGHAGLREILIFYVPVGMYMHNTFHSCTVITVTTNIYIFDKRMSIATKTCKEKSIIARPIYSSIKNGLMCRKCICWL
jgi:hypothetical protein